MPQIRRLAVTAAGSLLLAVGAAPFFMFWPDDGVMPLAQAVAVLGLFLMALGVFLPAAHRRRRPF